MSAARPGGLARAPVAALAYTAITLAMTWPLVGGLGRDVAWDLGDSLLNMWILGWDCTQLAAILGGDVGRIATFFNANIFHPEPLTLAYSEHLFAQAVQILPLYLATDNPILCYNILFLSTFVLSGLGTYLFVRELTGNHRAAFIAGLMFAFAPYRLAQSAHLQVLSSQWMPLALYALRRYFVTGRRRPLAGAVAAMVAQSLSSGYYLLYFTPFVAGYVLWEVAVRRLWRSRVPVELTVAALLSAAITLPFFLPYVDVRDRLGRARDVAEIARYSADTYAYLTSSVHARLWGPVAQVFFRPEGELFPGLLPVALALVGIGAWLKRGTVKPAAVTASPARAGTAQGASTESGPAAALPLEAPADTGARAWVAGIALIVSAAALGVALVLIFERRMVIDLYVATVRAGSVTRPLVIAAAGVCVAALTSRRVRSVIDRLARSPEAYLLAMLIGAWWLSLGPRPTALGRPLDLAAPYGVLFEHVPGFQGVRVPARFAMIVCLALAGLAGFGVQSLERWRWSKGLQLGLAAGFLVEAATVPFLVNGMTPLRDVATPEGRVYRPARAPRVYRAVGLLPDDAVLIEFPFGHPDYDVRAVYYTTAHWRRLVNGYSGFFPAAYSRYTGLFTDILRHKDLSTAALRETGATHAIVHEAAFLGGEGPQVSEWLQRSGAVEVFRDSGDVLFRLAP